MCNCLKNILKLDPCKDKLYLYWEEDTKNLEFGYETDYECEKITLEIDFCPICGSNLLKEGEKDG